MNLFSLVLKLNRMKWNKTVYGCTLFRYVLNKLSCCINDEGFGKKINWAEENIYFYDV